MPRQRQANKKQSIDTHSNTPTHADIYRLACLYLNIYVDLILDPALPRTIFGEVAKEVIYLIVVQIKALRQLGFSGDFQTLMSILHSANCRHAEDIIFSLFHH